MLVDNIHASDTTVTFIEENKPISDDYGSKSNFASLYPNDTFVADPIEKAVAAMTRRPRERDSRSGSLPAAYLFPDAAPVAEQPYGWVVVCAVFGIHVIIDGLTYSFGILEPVILDEYSSHDAFHVDTAMIMSILLGVTYGCGPLASQVCMKFGLRPVAMLGSCLACAGFLLSMFAKAIWQLDLTFGALVGLGFGFMYLPAIVSVASWFEEHRTLATSLAVCGSGIGTFIFAPLISFLVEEFGLPGTFLTLSGVALQGVVFASLLRTPPRHEADRKLLALRRSAAKAACESSSTCDDVGRWCMENVDWRLFRNWKFLIYCCSSFLGGVSCYIPYMHLKEWAKQRTETDDLHASLLVSIVGIASIFGRLGAGIHSLAERFCVHELVIYSFCCVISGVATSATVLLGDFIGFAVYAAVFGFCGGVIVALQSVVLTDIVGVARISHAFGILLFVQGLATLLGPPLAGHLVDTQQGNYVLSFIVTGIVMALSGIVLVLLPITKLLVRFCK